MKARELYIKRRGTYEKVPGEDLRSIVTGVKQPKGAIHIQICPPLRPDEIEGLAAGESGNDMIRGVASLIDRRIYAAYRLFPTNYMAYDMRSGVNAYEGEQYGPQQREEFVAYLKGRVAGLDGDADELFDRMVDSYANPVKNKLSLG